MSTDKYPCIFSREMETARVAKKNVKNSYHSSLHLARKYARIFVLGHYLILEAHSFRSRKTVRLSEQTMSEDKYPCIFSRQMKAIVYIYPFSSGDYLLNQKWLNILMFSESVGENLYPFLR